MTATTSGSPLKPSIWAGAWTALLALVFVATTALTIGIWLGDATYTDTNPVTDLGFLMLGGIITTGFGSQVRASTRHPAGALQALIGSVCLGVAGAAGQRIEPAVGGLVLAVAASVMVLRHRGWSLRLADGLRPPIAVLAVTAVVAGGWYASEMLILAQGAGPSCFLGRCVTGDRYAELAALALAIAGLAIMVAIGANSRRLTAWSASAAAATLGGISVLLPAAAGSLGVLGGVGAIVWAALFLTFTQHRS